MVPLDPPPSGIERQWLDFFAARGGTPAMLRQTMADPDLMDRVIAVIQNDARTLLEAASSVHLVREGLYEFVDPGLSLLALTRLPLLQERKLLRPCGWLASHEWARQARPARRRRLSLPVEGSFSLPFSEQVKLLADNQRPIETSVLVTFLLLRALADGTRLLHDHSVRTAEEVSHDLRVYVGPFGPEGLQINYHHGSSAYGNVGLAASTEWHRLDPV